VAAGGEAVAAPGDVATWETGEALVGFAVETYGDLHVLVNNAGTTADRFLANMTEDEWDGVVRAHLKGTFVPTRWAAAWWRDRARAGEEVEASVVCTTSTSGLVGNPGQSNYGAAKAGVAAFTVIAAAELAQYGVRVNAVAPLARTRLTEAVPGLAERMAPPADPDAFDPWHPANVAPVVAWLASAGCDVTGRVFLAQGGRVELYRPWSVERAVETEGRWSAAELAAAFRR
jgi:NAD(P)-dependent dehydrogenase (short-subunit alcohol dehydrogenase family)